MCLCLIVGSAYHKSTDSKAERASGVISDTLRAYADGRKDGCDSRHTLAEFAMYKFSTTVKTPHQRSATTRRLSSSAAAPVSQSRSLTTKWPPASRRRRPPYCAQRIRAMEATVRELLAAAQAARKATLDAGRGDTAFKVGDRAAADQGAAASHARPTVNVYRLKPVFERAGAPSAPGLVANPGQEGEHKVELLLNRRRVRRVTRYPVCWRGHSACHQGWQGRRGARAAKKQHPGLGRGELRNFGGAKFPKPVSRHCDSNPRLPSHKRDNQCWNYAQACSRGDRIR